MGQGWRLLVGVGAGAIEVFLGVFLLLATWAEPAATEDSRWLVWAALVAVGVMTGATFLVLGRGHLSRLLRRPLSLVASGTAVTLGLGLLQLWHLTEASRCSRARTSRRSSR